MASVASTGLACCGGFGISGVVTAVADCVNGMFIGLMLAEAAAIFQRFAWICWIFFCSFSFCVSANLTTSGAEQPSIVWLWCKDCKGSVSIIVMG